MASSSQDIYESIGTPAEIDAREWQAAAADALSARAAESDELYGDNTARFEEDYEYDYYQCPSDKLDRINKVRYAFIIVIVINCFLLVLFVIAKTPIGQGLWQQDVDVAKTDKVQQHFTSTDVIDNFKLCTACEKIENKVRYRYTLEQLRSDEHPDVCCFQKMSQLFWFFEKNVEEAINKKKVQGSIYSGLTTEILHKPIAHLIYYKTLKLSHGTTLVYTNINRAALTDNGIELKNAAIEIARQGAYFIYVHVTMSRVNFRIMLKKGVTLLMQASVQHGVPVCVLQGVFLLQDGDQLHVIASIDEHSVQYSYFGIHQI